MVAARTTEGSVTVFELLAGQEIESGDILTGTSDELDTQEIYNATRGEKLKVFIHEHCRDVSEAIQKHFAPAKSGPPRRPMWPLRGPAVSR